MATRKTTTTKTTALNLGAPADGITRGWKVLHGTFDSDGEITSDYDGSTWTIGEWRSVGNDDPIRTCHNGFHMSPTPCEAFGYITGSILALVEARGDVSDSRDKSAHREMRIIAAWPYGYSVNDGLQRLSQEVMAELSDVYPDSETAWDAFYVTEGAANQEWRNAVTPLNEAYRTAIQPIGDHYDTLHNAARKAYSDAKEAARSAYYAALNAAEEAYGVAAEKLEAERKQAIAPAEAVRTMQEFPHTQKMKAVIADAAKVRDAAIQKAEADAAAKRQAVQSKTADKTLTKLGTPSAVAPDVTA